jgi:hypothetical protein
MLANPSERVAQAANGDVLTTGGTFTETTAFQVTNSGGDAAVFTGGTGAAALTGTSGGSGGLGVWGYTDAGSGVVGSTGGSAVLSSGVGVIGQGMLADHTGVRRQALGGNGVGVRGESAGAGTSPLIGVFGISDPHARALAVPGQPAGGYGLTNGSAAGVAGQSNTGPGAWSASSGDAGVLASSGSGIGIQATSTSNYGAYVTSTNSAGLVASTNNGTAVWGAANGYIGVLGNSSSSIGGYFASGSNTGLYATGPSSNYAARFDGNVLVNGAFTVLGSPKSAAVLHPDGTHRRLYCVESPESWFEDFGRGQLANGRASVPLDRDFAALVHNDSYDVFLTPYGDTKGLYVGSKGPDSFEVREVQGGNSSLAFSYRVVAKRKDIAGPRLEKVDIPPAPPRPGAPQPPPALPHLDPPRTDPNAPPQERRAPGR